MATRRIYVVTDVTGEQRLVEASSQAQAISHVVRRKYVANVATQTELVERLGTGAKVEKAGEEPAEK